MDTREIMIKAVHALLSSGSYDDLNEEQNSVVVEFETEIMKAKVDELRKTMPLEEIKANSEIQEIDGTNIRIRCVRYKDKIWFHHMEDGEILEIFEM